MKEKRSVCYNLWAYSAASAVLIIVIAAIIWSHAHPFGLHWDEAEYLDQSGIDVQRLWAGKILSLGGRILLKGYGHPPAYRFIVLPFLAIFGFHVMVARLVSLGCYVLSCWFLYRAGDLAAGRAAGALAVLIFALSPEVIAASIFFGTDTSLYLAISAMLYYLFRAWSEEKESRVTWIGLGVSIGIGLLAKQSFLPIAIPILVFWLIAGHYGWLQIPKLGGQRKAIVLGLLIGAPWWLMNLRGSIHYVAYARSFVRNSLGSPSLLTWMKWLNSVVQGLLGHGIAILIVLVAIVSLVMHFKGKGRSFPDRGKAVLIACACGAVPIVLAQLSGTNYLLRHITPALIPLAVCVGVLGELSGWCSSWAGCLTSGILVCGQLGMLLAPVVVPNKEPIEIGFSNGVYPWQAMARFDQWDWAPVRVLTQNCGLQSPKIGYLGNGRAFDEPQIEYAWVSQGITQPDVDWLWRFEDGPINWQKLMAHADQEDVVITAPHFEGEVTIKENLDNAHNAEFAARLSNDPHFQHPTKLEMGRFRPIDVLVYVNSSIKCHVN